MDQRDIGPERGFHQCRPATDLDPLLAIRQLRIGGPISVRIAASPAPPAPHPFGKDALRVELHLQLARVHHLDGARIEPDMGGDEARHLSLGQQVVDAEAALVGVVLDDGQAALALADKLPDQREGRAGNAEAADHDRGPVLDTGDRLL